MTATSCYDAWRHKVPTEWKTRGLHWHCYAWQGDGASWDDDPVRNDPASDLPPIVVRDWLRKPSRLIRHAPTTPEDAVDWLRGQYGRYAAQLGSEATAIPDETRFGMALYDLRGGDDISWAFWLHGGTSIVTLAVVGTAQCRLHGRPGDQ